MKPQAVPVNGCIETIKISQKSAALWPLHLDRLQRSVFSFCHKHIDVQKLEDQVLAYIEQIKLTDFVLRIEYQFPKGFSLTHRPMPPIPLNAHVAIFPEKHLPLFELSWIKRNNRALYDFISKIKEEKKLDDLIILNENGMLAETTISNILLSINQEWHTPSLDQGCVDGIFRRKFLAEKKKENILVHERIIRPEELLHADAIWLCNAVRGLYPATLSEF